MQKGTNYNGERNTIICSLAGQREVKYNDGLAWCSKYEGVQYLRDVLMVGDSSEFDGSLNTSKIWSVL
jgi:hypothetical protein